MRAKHELVSVVVPIFNEEDGIEQLKQKLQRLESLLADEFELEFVFVDDGSRDRTVEHLKRTFGNSTFDFRVVEHGVNRGVGAAMRTGFKYARGSLVCTIDADCSYSPEGLKLVLAELLSTRADIAVASPYHPQGGVEGVPGWRLALSKACSALYRLLSPVKLYTYTSVFRAYRAEVVNNVTFRADGFVSAAEILIVAARRGYTVVEVPMILRGRAIGRSKMKVLRTIGTHLRMLSGLVMTPQNQVRAPQSRMAVEKFGESAVSQRE